MGLAKVTTEVTYKVPDWEYCNMQGDAFGRHSKEKCRFCIKEKSHHRCALYNIVLDTSGGTLVEKTHTCMRATAGFGSVAIEEDEPTIDPKLIIKTTIQEYEKLYKKLRAQGYPEAIATKVAQETLLGGK